MTNNVFKKSLVIGIIVLFIGASIIPMIGAFVANDKNEYSSMDNIENLDRDGWWDSDWSYSKKITINHDMVAGDLQNFPVLISDISSDYINHAQSDGDDFVFKSEDSTKKYNHEIEYYDSSSGELIVWVNITSLSSIDDTVLYMYYGNPTCDNQQNVYDTWDSNYSAVYHMNDATSSSICKDSTANEHNGIYIDGHASPDTGKVGNSQIFSGDSNDYIQLNVAEVHLNPLNGTHEVWFKADSVSHFDVLICDYYDSINLIRTNGGPDGTFQTICQVECNDRWNEYSTGGRTTNWEYWACAFQENDQILKVNDATIYTDTSVDQTGFGLGFVFIGKNFEGTDSTDGMMDEVRISNIRRSNAWLDTCYNNQNDPSSFINIGSEIEGNIPPNTPSNPNPMDGEKNVDINADLSWDCSDPDGDELTYDVYFGTSSNPPLVESGITENTYDPGIMDLGETFYWKIVAEDDQGGSTTGPLWSFTTKFNNPPYTPSNPNPPDGATGVSVYAILSWTCSDPNGDELTYDVYFGTSSNPPLVSTGQSWTFYNPPGAMEYNTHYYWKIVAWDPYDASTTGPIWDFTTTSEPNNPPELPSNPSPEDGATDVNIEPVLSWSCSDPDGDDLVYDVYFEANDPTPDILVSDDQTDNVYIPGTLKAGITYYWQIIAKDIHGASTPGPIWSFTTKKESINKPPSIPIIKGPTSGKPGDHFSYTFISVDPEGDNVYYQIDWGDGIVDDWFGPFKANEIQTKTHGWDIAGKFTISARAKDVNDAIGEWGTLEVNIQKNKAINTPFLSFLQNFLSNHPNLFPILQKLIQRLGLQ